MYCVFLGKAVQTVNPPNGSVGLSQLTATGTKDATTFLRGDNTFASAGGTMTPAFYVFKNANQTVSNDADTLVSFQTEVFDTDNCFDNSSTYRFTPTVAGKYFIFASLSWETGGANNGRDVALRFNRSGTFLGYVGGWTNYTSYAFNGQTLYASTIQSFNGTTDYISCYGRLVANTTLRISGGYPDANAQSTVFGGYKIIE
jgi:hypothetical protein